MYCHYEWINDVVLISRRRATQLGGLHISGPQSMAISSTRSGKRRVSSTHLLKTTCIDIFLLNTLNVVDSFHVNNPQDV